LLGGCDDVGALRAFFACDMCDWGLCAGLYFPVHTFSTSKLLLMLPFILT
jgi:hypothetical protein